MNHFDEYDLFSELTDFKKPETPAATELPMTEKFAISKAAIKEQLINGKSLFLMTSFGKDSSVMTAIALEAIRELVADNVTIRTTYILNGNTGLENPLVESYAKGEIEDLQNYIQKHNLPVQFHQARPNQSNSFLANVLGGRNTLSMPGMDRKCQQQLKKAPLDKLKAKIKKLAAEERGVKKLEATDFLDLIGTRYDESNHRSAAMHARNESCVVPVEVNIGGTKSFLLSPLADFAAFDVFEFIGNVTSGRIQTYSTFEALTQIYRDSDKGECMVNLFIADKGNTNTSCGSRNGCYTCSAVGDDASMENMLEDEEGRFLWMKPLNLFRNYMVDTHWDMSKRSWLSRTADLEKGTINLAPNTYSPLHCLDLLRFAMSIDADEQNENPYNPRFCILPIEDIFYINALWGRYGYFSGFKVLEEYNAIYNEGARYYPPVVKNPVPRAPIPKTLTIPYCDEQYDHFMGGLRDISAATVEAEPLVTKDGHTYFDPSTGTELTINTEGAMNFLDWELEYVLENAQKWKTSPTSSVKTMMRYGILEINKGGHAVWDKMMRVADQHRRHGIEPEDLADPVVLKQKIFKNLGITDSNVIDILNLASTPNVLESKWEIDPRHNPVYKEQQLSFAM